MGPAVKKVFENPAPKNRLRIVTFMTDGYVGNDFQILSMVKKLRGKSRWFPFGTGNSVNRFLLDNMARVGGGEVAYVLLNSSGKKAAERFYTRIATPVLTDITIETDHITLQERYPEALADLWDRKPIVFKAKYTKAGKGQIIVKAHRGTEDYTQKLEVDLPQRETSNAAIASLWARAKVDALMDRDLMAAQRGRPKDDIKEAIVAVALKHRIMTQYTSFVAVEETTVTPGGEPATVPVPVEMPDGVNREGVFGNQVSQPGTQPRGGGTLRTAEVAGKQSWVGNGAVLKKETARSEVPSRSDALKRKQAPMARDAYRRHGSTQARNGVTQGHGYAGASVRENARPSMRPAPAPQEAPPPPAPAKDRAPGTTMEAKVTVAQKPSDAPATPPAVKPDTEEAAEERDSGLADERQVDISKLAPSLQRLLATGGDMTDYTAGAVHVKGGLITVKIWLNQAPDQNLLEKLNELGAQIQSTHARKKLIIATVQVTRLEALAQLSAVRLIEPAPAKRES